MLFQYLFIKKNTVFRQCFFIFYIFIFLLTFFIQKIQFNSRIGGVNVYFVNNKKHNILNAALSLLVSIFNICTFSNKSSIVKITSLDNKIPKTVTTISDNSALKITFLNVDQSDNVRYFRFNNSNLILNDIKEMNIDNKVINIGKSMFNKMRSLQTIDCLSNYPIKLRKGMFNQVHNVDSSLFSSSGEKKYGTVLIHKLDKIVEQNASPG